MKMENVEDGVPSPEASRDGEGAMAMYLVWEDLSVILPNSGSGHARKLLNGLTGFAEPGRLLAIMGPSGSGKSTLLDSLAGCLSLPTPVETDNVDKLFSCQICISKAPLVSVACSIVSVEHQSTPHIYSLCRA